MTQFEARGLRRQGTHARADGDVCHSRVRGLKRQGTHARADGDVCHSKTRGLKRQGPQARADGDVCHSKTPPPSLSVSFRVGAGNDKLRGGMRAFQPGERGTLLSCLVEG